MPVYLWTQFRNRWGRIWSRPTLHHHHPGKGQQAYSIINVCVSVNTIQNEMDMETEMEMEIDMQLSPNNFYYLLY